jgi:hypothetical protein
MYVYFPAFLQLWNPLPSTDEDVSDYTIQVRFKFHMYRSITSNIEECNFSSFCHFFMYTNESSYLDMYKTKTNEYHLRCNANI